MVTLRHALAGACALAVALPATSLAGSAPVERLAGSGTPSLFVTPTPPDLSTPALTTPFRYAAGVVYTEGAHGFAFADTRDHRILMVDNEGNIQLLAGSGGGAQDTSGPLATTSLAAPEAIAIDGLNAFVTSDYTVGGPHIRSFSTQTGAFTTVAVGADRPRDYSVGSDNKTYIAMGEGNGSVETINAPADSSSPVIVAGGVMTGAFNATSPTTTDIGQPWSVSVSQSTAGTFVTSTSDNKVFKVTGAGTAGDAISLVAGGGPGPSIGDGGSATAAVLLKPTSVVMLADGGFLVYDAGHARIRRVKSGTITTIAGNGTAGVAEPGTPANLAPLNGSTDTSGATPADMALSPDGLIVTQGPTGVVQLIPSTAITSGPTGFSTSRSASFGRASWDDYATYQCKLDAGSFGVCADLANLPDGQHSFSVRATTDGSDVDTTPATRTWTVDATPPSVPELVSPADGATAGTTFSWKESSDATSGIDRYELWVDGVKATADSTCAGGVCAATPPEIGDGTHTWQVKAIDKAGNESPSAGRTVIRAAAPVMSLAIGPTRALVNRPVTFDASKTVDPNGTVVRYEWDLDGDGSFETDTGATPTTSRSYAKPQTLTISVRATDNSGLTGVATGALVITLQPPLKQLGVSINDGDLYTNDPNVVVFAVWPSFASDALLSNDGGFKKAQSFPVAETIKWKLDSSGPERLPKTIYVRFTSGGQVSETFQDDIILDETPPKVLDAQLAPPPAATSASAAKSKLVSLKVKAKDNVSGVGRIQVTKNKHKPGKLLKFKRSIKVIPAKARFVRVRDRAGNFSRWRATRRR